MSAQVQIELLMNTLVVSGADKEKVSELKESFDENQVEIFLEKLSAFDGLDSLINDSEESTDQSNQLIDMLSELIINE
jgi:hypothetical protein|tara:strand:- start:131 stop:364 length:234 start_codon:yes stop_codon:yes gene_type:complete